MYKIPTNSSIIYNNKILPDHLNLTQCSFMNNSILFIQLYQPMIAPQAHPSNQPYVKTVSNPVPAPVNNPPNSRGNTGGSSSLSGLDLSFLDTPSSTTTTPKNPTNPSMVKISAPPPSNPRKNSLNSSASTTNIASVMGPYRITASTKSTSYESISTMDLGYYFIPFQTKIFRLVDSLQMPLSSSRPSSSGGQPSNFDVLFSKPTVGSSSANSSPTMYNSPSKMSSSNPTPSNPNPNLNPNQNKLPFGAQYHSVGDRY